MSSDFHKDAPGGTLSSFGDAARCDGGEQLDATHGLQGMHQRGQPPVEFGTRLGCHEPDGRPWLVSTSYDYLQMTVSFDPLHGTRWVDAIKGKHVLGEVAGVRDRLRLLDDVNF